MYVTTTATGAWEVWVTSCSTTATTATTTTGAWNTWCSSTTSSITTSSNEIWIGWLNDDNRIVITEEALRENQAQYEASLERERELQKKWAKEHEEKRAKAMKLLLDSLNRKQKRDFKQRSHFYVRGGKSGDLYKIVKGRQGNVKLMDKKKRVIQSLCAHPKIHCPDEDTMLVQKVMIEHMEDHFRDIANITYH